MRPVYVINHKAAMDDAFRPKKGCPACHLCRNAKSPTKPRQPFTCSKGLPMDAPRCKGFQDARKASFDYAKVYG